VLPPNALPAGPEQVDRSDPEWDYHRIAEVYLQGAGGFWLAHWEDVPVGHVGGQDIGGAVELRRMYVRQDFRRRGIGRDLVKALVAHCGAQGVPVIELWTAREGAGRKLYESIGFQMVANPGEAFANVEAVTGYTPGEDEIRMRLQLD